MRGVMLEVPDSLLEQRRTSGADQWDEAWHGVLHMVPPPNVMHQDLEWQIETWLRMHWQPTRAGNLVYHQVALSPIENWVKDYRTPDVVLFNSDDAENLRDTYCHGPCTVAIEIRLPNDESLAKLEFYAKSGVSEVWIIDRDGRQPEIHVLQHGNYQVPSPSTDGWLRSSVVSVMMKCEENKLAFQIPNHTSTRLTF